MCISCNNIDGYFEIFNESQNIGSFIKCSKEIYEGYYFDNNEQKIKKCYPTCKSCDERGNKINNKCTDCYLNNILINENCYEKCDYYYFFNSSNIYQCTTDENCPNEYNKLIEVKKQCIDNCQQDNDYKYEFNDVLYSNCPNGTKISQNNNYLCVCNNYFNYEQTGCIEVVPEGYYLNDSEYKTIDKCDIKCKECSKESVLNNICISCNKDNNYYPKFNDILSIAPFMNCYNEVQDGYYFDNNEQSYMPCYSTCQKCNESGDIYDHKCKECDSNYIKIANNCYHKCLFYFFLNYSEIYQQYQCTPFNYCPDGYSNLIMQKKQCIDDCSKDDTYIYNYNKICYSECREETKLSNYKCIEKIQCNENYPYIIIETRECAKNCSAINFLNLYVLLIQIIH